MKGILRFMEGLILGGAVGAGIGFLLAPSSGDKLRSDLQARRERLQYEMDQAAAQKRAELEQQLAILRAPKG